MSNQISQQEDHELALREIQDKYAAELARIAKIQEAEIVKRVAAALALTARAPSPLHGKSLFRPTYTSPIKNPLPKSSSAASPSLVASSSATIPDVTIPMLTMVIIPSVQY